MKISNRAMAISPSLTLEITAKANKMKQNGLDVISFGAGEPDFNTPDFIVRAAKKAMDDGLTKYTPAAGTLSLRKAIAGKLLKENGLTYAPSEIVVSNGAKQSLYNALQAVVNPGDEVIIPAPYWLTYPELVKLCGGKPIIVYTERRNGFKLSAGSLSDALSENTKVVILNSPNNPTGAVYTEDEYRALIEVLKPYKDVYIISDEIYENLVYDDAKTVSFGALDEEIKARTILVNGVSKTFSMTGWRIGYTASDEAVAKAMSSMQSHTTSNPNTIAQYAAEAAFLSAEGEGFVLDMRKEFAERKKLLIGLLDKTKVLSAVDPKGAFYCMVSVKECFGKSIGGKKIVGALSFAEALLEKEKVAVIPCESFGAQEYIRLSYAISRADVEKGVERIIRFAESLE